MENKREKNLKRSFLQHPRALNSDHALLASLSFVLQKIIDESAVECEEVGVALVGSFASILS